DVRAIAQSRHVGQDRRAEAAEERQTFAAEDREADLRALTLPLAHQEQNALEDVCVQTTSETTIRGHDDDSNSLRLTLLQERMTVVGIGLREVADHVTHLLRVGPRQLH